MATDTVRINVLADTKKAQGNVKTLAGNVAALSAAVVGLVALGKGMGELIQKFKQQEQAEAKLTAVIKATGQAAGFTANELFEMADGLQQVTTFGDEAIIGAQTILATFKQIGHDIFPDVVETAADMATVFGTDLKSASIQLGKALQDPVKGVTALQRVGVTFTDSQREMIQEMTEAGDVAGAQAIIMAELEGQIGGASRAMAETATVQILTGAIKVFNDLDDRSQAVIAVVGGIIALGPPVSAAITAISVAMKNLELSTSLALGPITAVIAALALGTTSFQAQEIELIGRSFERAEKQGKSLAAEISVLANATGKSEQEIANLGVQLGFLDESFISVTEEMSDFQALQEALANKANQAADMEKIAADLRQKQADQFELLSSKAELFGDSIDLTAEKRAALNSIMIEGLESGLLPTGTTLTNMKALYESLAPAIDDTTDSIDEQKEAMEELWVSARAGNSLYEQMDRNIRNVTATGEAFKKETLDIFAEIEPAFENMKKSVDDLALTFTDTFATALLSTGKGFDSFKKAAKGMIVSVIEMFAQQFAAIGAGLLFSPVPGSRALGIGMIAAGVAAQATAAFVKSFAQGGQFTTNGPELIMVGDNAGGKERVTVEPISSSGTGGTQQMLTINLDGRQIFAGLHEMTINKEVIIDAGAVV
jgi:hypothetical protein